jgi:predicted DNA-binding transcriptional regulator AlpA
MTDNTSSKTLQPPAPIELWDRRAVLEFFGGTKPLHPSTLYRGLGLIYPRPINTSGNTVRWLADECRATLQRMIAERDTPASARSAGPFRRDRNDACPIRYRGTLKEKLYLLLRVQDHVPSEMSIRRALGVVLIHEV